MEDYGAYATEPVTAAGFEELDTLIQNMVQVQSEVEDAEKALKKAQQQLRDLSEIRIPDQMEEMGLEEFKNKNGLHVSVEKKLRHSITKDNKAAVMKWLEEHEHGDIIKRKVSVNFVVGEENNADELSKEMLGRFGSKTDVERTVASATVGSLLRALLADGKNVPLELFGAWEQKFTKIKSE